MIKTKRCKMSIIQDCDYEKVRELYSDEKVREFLGGIVSDERFVLSFDKMINSGDSSFYWAVRLIENNEFVGLVSLDRHHDGISVEVSYQFLPKYWGCGYAEEVIRETIHYGFDELMINRIVAETQSANKASCKLLQKIGMDLEETVTRFGAEQYIFSITKENA